MSGEQLRYDAPTNLEWDSLRIDVKHSDDEKRHEQYYDPYATGIKNISDLENLNPVDQLKYLSDIDEAADANTQYAIGEAISIFREVSENSNFSPFIRIAAKAAAERQNPNRENIYPEFNYGERLGYSVLPHSESLTRTDYDSMTEDEIRNKINKLQNSNNPKEYSQYDDSASVRFELEAALDNKIFNRNQEKLHQEFPSLPENEWVIKIASDAAASVEFEKKFDEDEDVFSHAMSIGLITNRANLLAPATGENPAILDEESIQYLRAVHKNSAMKFLINEKLGIDIVKISLDAQVQLLKFMTRADDNRFDSLCSTLHQTEPELRLKLAEGFLAADFGEDFGDALLDIANSERISSEQLEKILDQVSSCRESIKGIAGLYTDFDDGSFARDYSRAANERLTDAVTVFKEIAAKGKAEGDLGWAGEIELDYNAAMEALKYEANSLAIINGTINDVISGRDGAFAERFLSPDAQHTRSMYNFYSPNHGYVMLYTRPEGASSFDPSIEYGKYRNRYDEEGKNIGAEASISFITNPVNPFELPSPYRPNRHNLRDPDYYDSPTMNKVSAIRIDREGRSLGMSHDDENRSPINNAGIASVDLAAIGDRADTPSGKIARLISVGNQLRQNADENELSLNHNIIGGGNYGEANKFKELVDFVDKSTLALCALHPPSKTEGFTGAKRAERQRVRARKALNKAA